MADGPTYSISPNPNAQPTFLDTLKTMAEQATDAITAPIKAQAGAALHPIDALTGGWKTAGQALGQVGANVLQDIAGKPEDPVTKFAGATPTVPPLDDNTLGPWHTWYRAAAAYNDLFGGVSAQLYNNYQRAVAQWYGATPTQKGILAPAMAVAPVLQQTVTAPLIDVGQIFRGKNAQGQVMSPAEVGSLEAKTMFDILPFMMLYNGIAKVGADTPPVTPVEDVVSKGNILAKYQEPMLDELLKDVDTSAQSIPGQVTVVKPKTTTIPVKSQEGPYLKDQPEPPPLPATTTPEMVESARQMFFENDGVVHRTIMQAAVQQALARVKTTIKPGTREFAAAAQIITSGNIPPSTISAVKALADQYSIPPSDAANIAMHVFMEGISKNARIQQSIGVDLLNLKIVAESAGADGQAAIEALRGANTAADAGPMSWFGRASLGLGRAAINMYKSMLTGPTAAKIIVSHGVNITSAALQDVMGAALRDVYTIPQTIREAISGEKPTYPIGEQTFNMLGNYWTTFVASMARAGKPLQYWYDRITNDPIGAGVESWANLSPIHQLLEAYPKIGQRILGKNYEWMDGPGELVKGAMQGPMAQWADKAAAIVGTPLRIGVNEERLFAMEAFTRKGMMDLGKERLAELTKGEDPIEWLTKEGQKVTTDKLPADVQKVLLDARTRTLGESLALDPTSKLAKGWLDITRRWPWLLLVTPTFPRYTMNIIRQWFENSPGGVLGMFEPEWQKAMMDYSTNPVKTAAAANKFASGVRGLLSLATAWNIRNSQYAGPRYDQIDLGDDPATPGKKRIIDSSAFPTLKIYLGIAEILKWAQAGKNPNDALTPEEKLDLLTGIRNVTDAPMFNIGRLLEMMKSDDPSVATRIPQEVLGRFLAGYIHPLTTIDRFNAALNPDSKSSTRRDTRNNELIGIPQAAIPGVNRGIPARVSPYTGEAVRIKHPMEGFIVGNIPPMTKLEAEMTKLPGYTPTWLYGNHPNPIAERLVQANVGKILDKYQMPNGQSFGDMLADILRQQPSDARRLEILKIILPQLRKAGEVMGRVQNNDAFADQDAKRLPKEVQPLYHNNLVEDRLKKAIETEGAQQ